MKSLPKYEPLVIPGWSVNFKVQVKWRLYHYSLQNKTNALWRRVRCSLRIEKWISVLSSAGTNCPNHCSRNRGLRSQTRNANQYSSPFWTQPMNYSPFLSFASKFPDSGFPVFWISGFWLNLSGVPLKWIPVFCMLMRKNLCVNIFVQESACQSDSICFMDFLFVRLSICSVWKRGVCHAYIVHPFLTRFEPRLWDF